MQGKSELNHLVHKDIFLVADELGEAIKERSGTPQMPTGMEDLDNIIWGVHRKELLIIAARPSQGKTSLSVQIAWNLAKAGKKVLFVSLEMSSHAVLERILCNEFLIKGWLLRKGDEEERQKAIACIDQLKARLMTYPLTIVDDWGFKADHLEQLVRLNQADVLVVDHLQRISSNGYKSRQECLADYVQECKAVAMRNNCATILASQINRQGADQKSSMNFVKGTGEAEEAADTLISCNWIGRAKAIESPYDETIQKGEYQISVDKQRHGPVDFVTLDFDVQYYKFNKFHDNVPVKVYGGKYE
jgi:replicative DNA helicase